MVATEHMKRMQQLSLAQTSFLAKTGKQPLKAVILTWRNRGLIDTIECTTAEVADTTMMGACLHGDETIAFGDRSYHRTSRAIVLFEKEGELSVLTPTQKLKGVELTDEQKTFNRMLSAVRAIVERRYRMVKLQFNFVKVRYRGLARNNGQIVTEFALANPWLTHKRLLPC